MIQITKEVIVKELRNMGIMEGMELEVHSSLSSFGYVAGGAITIIDALKETVTEKGSIFMPALRLSEDLPLDETDIKNGLIKKIKILAENEQKSRCGVVADVFRTMPDTKQQDGIFAISAWGKNADKVSNGLEYIIDNQGKALLMGVDIYSLTAMHYVEEYLPDEILKKFKSDDIDRIYPSDQWLVETGKLPKAWYKIQNMAKKEGLIKEHKVGMCNCMYFDVASVINIYKEELINNPFRLYEIEK